MFNIKLLTNLSISVTHIIVKYNKKDGSNSDGIGKLVKKLSKCK